MITINLLKATDIAKQCIRDWREVEFRKNDILIQNAIVEGKDTSNLLERRDYLRDLPNVCEGKSLEELKYIISTLS